jgi:hypothetical protein
LSSSVRNRDRVRRTMQAAYPGMLARAARLLLSSSLSMNARRLHKLIGLVMLLPFFGWAVTGTVFFIKPGYAGAYEILQAKTYPMDKTVSITPSSEWREYRCLRTILGDHLLVRTSAGWSNLDPLTLQERKHPSADEITRLIDDATSPNQQRYGKVVSVNDLTARTATGVEIRLNWDRMSLEQRGLDTVWLDRLYKVHYLQWTGFAILDRVLGVTGLALILVLSILGIRLALR